jgi:hypothetical protein
MGQRWHRTSRWIFFYGKRNENHELGTVFSIHERIISTVKEGRVYWLKDAINKTKRLLV